MTARYLVTGCQGFVGRFVVARILDLRGDVRILGVGRSTLKSNTFTHVVSRGGIKTSAPFPSELQSAFQDPRYEYAVADLTEPEPITSLLTEFRPHYVIHLASGLRGDPLRELCSCNIEATRNLLDAVGRAPVSVRKVVLGSTGGVYGMVEDDRLPIAECQSCKPNDLYSTSKLAAEHVAQIVAHCSGLPVVIARMFNLLGPGQDERHVCGRFVAQLAAIKAQLSAPELTVGCLTTTRDMIDVRDVASGLLLLADQGAAGEIYNLASGREVAIHEILDLCLAATGLSDAVAICQQESRPTDVSRHFADVRKIKHIGFAIRFPLSQSIRDICQYYERQVAEAVRMTAN